MEPAMLIPAADPVYSAPIWFESLRIGGFFAHLLMMNTVLGLSVIALAMEARVLALGLTPRNDALNGPLHAVATRIPTALALAVNFGVVPLLFLQVVYGQFFYTSSVLMAWWWLAVIGLVMLAYYGLYIYDFKFHAPAAVKTLLLLVVVACLLLTSFIYVNNMTLMLDPKQWTGYFKAPGGTLLNRGEPTLWPRWLHFLFGSLAVGGLLFAHAQARKAAGGDPAAKLGVRVGLRWFGHATFFQLLVGLWFLLSLPDPVSGPLLRGGPLLLLLLAGIAGGFLSLLFAVKQQLWAASWTTLGTLILMVTLRELVRGLYLAPYFKPSDLLVVPQYSPMVLFFCSLALGLGLIVWMLRRPTRSGKPEAKEIC
jgi:hypothetical protein